MLSCVGGFFHRYHPSILGRTNPRVFTMVGPNGLRTKLTELHLVAALLGGDERVVRICHRPLLRPLY